MNRAYSDFLCHRGHGLLRVALDRQVLPTFLQTNPEKTCLRVRHHAGIQPRGRYSVRLYVVAIFFVIFEVNGLPLPLGSGISGPGTVGPSEMLVFLGTLIGAISGSGIAAR